MNITVTFSGPGDIPDGTTITFEDVDKYELSMPSNIEQVACDEAGCKGCRAVHRRLTGTHHLHLGATSARSKPLWSIPEVTG